MIVKNPPEMVIKTNKTIFFAGSIEMGTAEDWQKALIQELGDLDVTVLNPRRDDWDSSWEQTKQNKPFFDQVNWELEGILETADIICFYFDANTKSPITLLELGLALAAKKEIAVFCTNEFWRKGNVDITCNRYGVEVFEDFNLFVSNLRSRLT